MATGDEVLLLRAKEIFENLEETNREDYARLLKHLGTLYSTNGHDPKEAGSEKKNHVLFVMSTWWFEIERKARKFFFVFLAPSSDARSPLVASWLLVAMPGAPSRVLAPSSDARSP